MVSMTVGATTLGTATLRPASCDDCAPGAVVADPTYSLYWDGLVQTSVLCPPGTPGPCFDDVVAPPGMYKASVCMKIDADGDCATPETEITSDCGSTTFTLPITAPVVVKVAPADPQSNPPGRGS